MRYFSDSSVSKLWHPAIKLEEKDRTNRIPNESKSLDIGSGGCEIEVGGSFVIFEPETFEDVQTVTVKAEIDPERWPPGKVAVTPILYIDAKKLQKSATVRLHTWLVSEKDGSVVDIMHYNRHKEWEIFTTCSIGDSEFIEFQTQNFCRFAATPRNAFNNKYKMRPIICFKSEDFVLALVQDDELIIKEFRNTMKEDLGGDVVIRRLQSITCNESDCVECWIEAEPIPKFKFLVEPKVTHYINNIVENCEMSYKLRKLVYIRDGESTKTQDRKPEAIKIEFKVDGNLIREPDCFAYMSSHPGKLNFKIYSSVCSVYILSA